MGYARSLIVGLIASQTIAVAAMAGGRTNASETSAVVHRQRENSSENRIKDNRVPAVTPLDRVATAVDGAESSHGTDIGMWRADPSGPQGPMQVSEAAATDAGGGDRFDLAQNRAIGRAYLAQLYKRHRNWPDAIAAYNWGRDNMDAWVRAGRPPQEFLHQKPSSQDALMAQRPIASSKNSVRPCNSPCDGRDRSHNIRPAQ
jgi:Transglycosylase SLT domain